MVQLNLFMTKDWYGHKHLGVTLQAWLLVGNFYFITSNMRHYVFYKGDNSLIREIKVTLLESLSFF